MVQRCYRTHGWQIKGHDAIASYIGRKLKQKGFVVFKEPIFKVKNEKLKPDIVAVREDHAVLVDAQIISDSYDPEKASVGK